MFTKRNGGDMDYLPLMIGAFAVMMMTRNKNNAPSLNNVASLLSDPNALSALNSVGKLMNPKADGSENRTAVIFELLSNPFIGELLQKIMPQQTQDTNTEAQKQENDTNTSPSAATEINTGTENKSAFRTPADNAPRSEPSRPETASPFVTANNLNTPVIEKPFVEEKNSPQQETSPAWESISENPYSEIPSEEIANMIFKALK
jgi:hypothetical protein